ncbi:hypothetical protein SLA2020_503910 [Shorea laevis]
MELLRLKLISISSCFSRKPFYRMDRRVMGDSWEDALVMADVYKNRAERILDGNGDGGLFAYRGRKAQYKKAASLLNKAATDYKLEEDWIEAGSTYIKLANCLLKLERKTAAAQAYIDAADCLKAISSSDWNVNVTMSCLEQAMCIFSQTGKFSKAAKHCKYFAEFFKSGRQLQLAAACYEAAADFFQKEDFSSTSADECKQEVAQLAAMLGQYHKATKIYEEGAWKSLSAAMLKSGVKGNLLSAGICQLCKGDLAITNTLKWYQELDPSFSGTRENKFLVDVAMSIDAGDVARFTAAVNEFGSMTPLDPWQRTLLLRVEEKLKAPDKME